MARGRQVSTYIDEDGEKSIKALISTAHWTGSESKLVSRLIEFAYAHLDMWGEFNNIEQSPNRNDDIYKVMIALFNKEIEANMDSINTFLKGGK